MVMDANTTQDLVGPCYLLIGSMFFDMFDGRVARMTKTQTNFGMELDSLADMFSFGGAPAVLLYKWGLGDMGTVGTAVCFIFLACGGLRLARFNVIAKHKVEAGTKAADSYFIGLPIPCAAGLVISIVLVSAHTTIEMVQANYSSLFFILLVSFFMISNIKFRTFKDLSIGRLTPASLLMFSYIAIGLGFYFHYRSAAASLMTMGLSYVCLSIAEELLSSRRANKDIIADLSCEDDSSVEESLEEVRDENNSEKTSVNYLDR